MKVTLQEASVKDCNGHAGMLSATTVQINSNLTLVRMSLAETQLIFKFVRDLVASAQTCLG